MTDVFLKASKAYLVRQSVPGAGCAGFTVARIDVRTLAKIEALRLRDGVSPEQFLALATDAYALMLPGWPYPLADRERDQGDRVLL